jgi:hypothetical protein
MASFDRCDGSAIWEDAVFVLYLPHRLQPSQTSEEVEVESKNCDRMNLVAYISVIAIPKTLTLTNCRCIIGLTQELSETLFSSRSLRSLRFVFS